MSEHLRRWLEGFRQALRLNPGADYVLPRRDDFRRDLEALRGDARHIASDLRRNLRKARHESSYPR